MKIRTGFVSNSSSSSFLIIGTNKSHIIKNLLEKDKDLDCHDCSYGVTESERGINYYGGYFGSDVKEENIQLPDYAGIEAKEMLEKETVSELRKYFVGLVKRKYGIEIEDEDVDLFYGETSTG
jgi:hypothetical protein